MFQSGSRRLKSVGRVRISSWPESSVIFKIRCGFAPRWHQHPGMRSRAFGLADPRANLSAETNARWTP
eukprot:9250590-Pyramimonas_sp.AAC.1